MLKLLCWCFKFGVDFLVENLSLMRLNMMDDDEGEVACGIAEMFPLLFISIWPKVEFEVL